MPKAGVKGGRWISGVVVCEPAVAVIKNMARIVDLAGAGRDRAVTNVSRVGEAVAEDNDLGKWKRCLLGENERAAAHQRESEDQIRDGAR